MSELSDRIEEVDRAFAFAVDYLDNRINKACQDIQPDMVHHLIKQKQTVMKIWNGLIKIA